MIYVTADHHFGHANIIKYIERPFADADEMNEIMIRQWQETVMPEDTVYYLGDFTLGNIESFVKYALRLTGKRIYVIPGGHDKRWIAHFDRAPSEIRQRFIILPMLHTLRGHGQDIVMCHYPMLSWEKSHYGSLHLHGHCHGAIGCVGSSGDLQLPPGEKKGCRIDVGVDCWGFYPVPLKQLSKRDT